MSEENKGKIHMGKFFLHQGNWPTTPGPPSIIGVCSTRNLMLSIWEEVLNSDSIWWVTDTGILTNIIKYIIVTEVVGEQQMT